MYHLITALSDIYNYTQNANTTLIFQLSKLQINSQKLFVICRNINSKFQIDLTNISFNYLYQLLYDYLYSDINVNIPEFNMIYEQLILQKIKYKQVTTNCLISSQMIKELEFKLSSQIEQLLIEINSIFAYIHAKLMNAKFEQNYSVEKPMNINVIHVALHIISIDYEIIQYVHDKITNNQRIITSLDIFNFIQKSKYLFITYASTTPSWINFIHLYKQLKMIDS